jgi:hypothetical protein
MYQFAILLHLLLLTYWLGGDLGVFYSSRFVLRPELSPAQRTTALKIMAGCDLAPRVCLVLFLPSGVLLMSTRPHGADFLHAWQVGVVWALSLCWLAVALGASLREHDALLRRLDLGVRLLVVTALLGIGLYTIVAAEPFGVTTNPKWLGGKVVVYGLAILCGVLIRFRLRPFGPAFAELVTSGSSPDVEGRLRGAIRGSEPFVFGIWLCIATAAVLGVVKPGANL